MRQRLIDGSSLIILCLISNLVFGSTDNHLVDLKLKFPHGLVSDEHGILNVEDLAINACEVRPRPFNSTSLYYPYEYWQCFETKKISFNCDTNGTPDEHEGVMGLIVVKTSLDGIDHKYIAPRLWPIKNCKRFLKDAATLLKGEKYACVSGSFIENEKDRRGYLSTSWLFGRIKTKKGCEGQRCDLPKKFKQDNCPNLKL